MKESDLPSWMLGGLFVILVICAIMAEGCRKAEKAVPAVDLRGLYNECEVFTVEKQRLLVCQSGYGLTVTPLETQCNPK